jgi:hypothetical protein
VKNTTPSKKHFPSLLGDFEDDVAISSFVWQSVGGDCFALLAMTVVDELEIV